MTPASRPRRRSALKVLFDQIDDLAALRGGELDEHPE
jgi:hypothetical protein